MGRGKLEEIGEELRVDATSLNALAEIFDSSIEKEIFDELDLSNRKAKLKQIKAKAERFTFEIEKKIKKMRSTLDV